MSKELLENNDDLIKIYKDSLEKMNEIENNTLRHLVHSMESFVTTYREKEKLMNKLEAAEATGEYYKRMKSEDGDE